jgi:spore coat polysaccharide biosynthesis protein SpsF
MSKPVIAAIIQSRMTSTRLAGKVMMPLPFPEGEPLVNRIVRKLRKTGLFDHVVVATSTGDLQRPLTEFMDSAQIAYFQGDENHVLSRFIHIIKMHQPDFVVRITCDNPFIDAGLMAKTIDFHTQSGVDYTISRGLPYGMNMEVCKSSALLALDGRTDLLADEEEHVTLRFHRDNNFEMNEYYPFGEDDFSGIRVTVDTITDYMRAALLVKLQESYPEMDDCEFIVMANRKHPDIFRNENQS